MKKNTISWILCICIYMCAGTAVVVSPVTHTLAVEFPEAAATAVRSIVTIPSLVAFAGSFWLAAKLGKSLRYRSAILLGNLFCMVGGVMPVFLNGNFPVVLCSRVIFGIGYAMFSMRNAIATKVYGEKQAAEWIGYGWFVMNGTSVVLQLFSGWLADFDWRYSFMIHGIILIPLALSIVYFKEPQQEQGEMEKVPETREHAKSTIPGWKAWGFALLTAMGSICVFPVVSSISTLINSRGMGSAAQAGIVTSAFTVGTALAGITFGKLYQKISRWLVTGGSFLAAAGFLLILTSGNLINAAVGAVCCGAGFSYGMLCYSTWAMDVSTPANRALSMTLISSFVSAGSFLSSYLITAAGIVGQWIPFFQTELEKAFVIGCVFYVIQGVVYGIRDRRPVNQ